MTLPDDPRIRYAECDPSLCPCQRGLECDCEAGDEGKRFDEQDEAVIDELVR